MADSLFDKLQAQAFKGGVAPRTAESLKWFRTNLKNMRGLNRGKIIRDSALTRVSRPMLGEMYMYTYDAKHKDTLPYWDAFPLIILVDRAPGGFYGLNLHYLPLILRAKFFDELIKTTNGNYDSNTRMKARYRLIKTARKMRYFKPCLKHYLSNQITSRIMKVNPTEWEVALFLPVQQFKGATVQKVWKDSKEIVNG